MNNTLKKTKNPRRKIGAPRRPSQARRAAPVTYVMGLKLPLHWKLNSELKYLTKLRKYIRKGWKS
jgi:hypothetical protein